MMMIIIIFPHLLPRCQSFDPVSARSHLSVTHGFVQAAPDTRTRVPGGGKSSFYGSDLSADWTPGDIQSWATRGDHTVSSLPFMNQKRGGDVNEGDAMIGKINMTDPPPRTQWESTV